LFLQEQIKDIIILQCRQDRTQMDEGMAAKKCVR